MWRNTFKSICGYLVTISNQYEVEMHEYTVSKTARQQVCVLRSDGSVVVHGS